MNAGARNPFNVDDFPDPLGQDVTEFAAVAAIGGASDDDNARPWGSGYGGVTGIEGAWSSRWNSDGLDWQQGTGELRTVDDRVYILFNWNAGTSRGLIEARRDGDHRLVGRYLNLENPAITRPWVGVIVDERRIDGQHSGGRIDFRR